MRFELTRLLVPPPQDGASTSSATAPFIFIFQLCGATKETRTLEMPEPQSGALTNFAIAAV